MDPITIATTVLTLLEKYGPDLVNKVMSYAHKNDPSQADWDALFAQIKDLDYAKFITEARDRRDKADGTGVYAPPATAGGTP